MHLNVGKCRVMHYGKRNPNYNYYMKMDGLCTIIVFERDLGVFLSNDEHFSRHVSKRSRHVIKGYRMLRQR